MKIVPTDTGEALALEVRAGKGGPLLVREFVTYSDLLPARDETWWHGLQAGALGCDLGGLQLRLRARPSQEGYSIELQEGERSFRRDFSAASLAHVLRRAALALAEQETPADKETSVALTTVPAEAAGSTPDTRVLARRRSEAPVFEPGCLADHLARSEPLLGAAEEHMMSQPPVFIPTEVWEEGHVQARRGGERESAAVLTGRLFRDSQSQAVFVLVDACLEAEHASEEPLAVTFSDQTWARLGEALRLRRRRLNHPHERLLGSVHGHNFKPAPDADGRLACERCAVARVCARTTATLSSADRVWHQAVFAGQPWAVSVIWGHSARGEDWRMYGLSDAQLAPRPVHLLRS